MEGSKKQESTMEELAAGQVVNDKFITALTQQLNEKTKYGLAFPKDYNVANALMGAYLMLKDTVDKNGKPVLDACTRNSVANALMDMVVVGLDVQKKQGYFIAYGNKLLFQKSYFGNIAIARRYGLKSINAEVIYEGDVFEYSIIDGRKIFEKHEQELTNIDSTKLKGAYAIAMMEDGSKVMEVMNMPQIKQSWQQGYGYKENSGVHSKFPDQMAKKTVINRLCKMITNTYGDGNVIETYERLEEEGAADILAENVAYEINQNANKEDFVPDKTAAIEEKPEQPDPFMQDVVARKKQEKASLRGNGRPLPDFMKEEALDN